LSKVTFLTVCLSLVFGWQLNAIATQVTASTAELSTFKARMNEAFSGDIDQLRQRRIIRVLVSYNRTHFFMGDEGMLGLEYELLKAYEHYLNRGPLREQYKTHLVFIVSPFQDLIDQLNAGYGDIIAAGLTITPGRESQLSFTQPYLSNINEILISHNRAPHIQRLEDLAGQRVIVVSNSSYIVHLEMINQALGLLGLPPIEIIKANPLLEAEDLLEMINARIYDFTVVDAHIAKVWQNIYQDLVLNEHIVLHHNGKIAWGVRKQNPKLLASLNQFIQQNARPGQLLSNLLFRKYFENTTWIARPLTPELLLQVDYLKPYFQLYGDFYDLDWLTLAALAYQESHFKHQRISPKGAVGIMQILPSTAEAMDIGDINDLEHNIHAGTKYLRHLQDTYFNSLDYSAQERINFSLAAYNAGPHRIRQLQRQAQARGLNPHKWFYHVEQIAREQIGQETVNYVIGILKHRVALEAAQKVELERHLARPVFTLPQADIPKR